MDFNDHANFRQAEQKMLSMLQDSPVVPLMGIDKPDQFESLIIQAMEATPANKTPAIEILLRNKEAVDVGLAKVKELKEKYGNQVNILIGSVIKAIDVDKAFAAGADGIVSGGFSQRVANAALQKGMPYLPGCMKLEEVKQADEMGLKVIKLFPARSPSVKAIMAPLQRTRIMYENPDPKAIKCTTPTEVLSAWEKGEAEAIIEPANSGAQWNAIMTYLEEKGMVACCTGGAKPDNLHEFAQERQVIGVGASFIAADMTQAAEAQSNALTIWENTKSNAPAANINLSL